MSQELREHVNEVLHEADASSGSLVTTSDSDDGADETAQTDLLETAAKANDLLESAESEELLEAVGLDTLPDGTEPDSIPAAIAQGDPAQVEELQRLLNLSKLADWDDGEALEGAVGELQAAIGDGERTAESGSIDDGTDETEADTADESTDESDGTDTSSDLGDQLRSAMESSFEGIGDDLEQLQGRLEEASASTVGEDDGADDEDEATADQTDAEDDDGLLDAGLGSNQNRETSGGSGTRYSTMAPPPSERADMKGTARHSTMPDKH
ncbi:hypothetical protein [Natronorubrum thiooxidans]|uniref:Uncharacterized protein n=1 Tax=Natronorubrum thiooxidans TaxID=308853 RepID=A0A1N7DED8_9EURY|nr:hypothetical protein [Natronorubrum thiooxidans]SIR74168.1 hypothetical protein SAMN05421752_102193 [Natronorubrum thiooxidans]